MVIKTLSGQLGVGETSAEIKAAVESLSDNQLRLQLAHVNVDVDVDADVELGRLRIEEKTIEAETRATEAIQKTVQAEQQFRDTYTKQTLPMLARQSFYAGTAYTLFTILIAPILEKLISGLEFPEFNIYVAGALYSLAVEYTGARSFDKWKGLNK